VNDELLQVSIKILEKDYRIACQPHQQDDLQTSARLLDQRMREIHKHGRVIGTDRIAVMAALNIAHELIQLQRTRPTLDDESALRLQRLQMQITTALASATAVPESLLEPLPLALEPANVPVLDASNERV
jgi:cell division protein ZapA